MESFPHHYAVTATSVSDSVILSAAGLPVLDTAAPKEFDGPGDKWSPETLLVGAIADCFILTFRSIANASHFQYNSVSCEVHGELDRVEKQTRFTKIKVCPHLVVQSKADEEKGLRLLKKAEENCLVSNSMSATVLLEAVVDSVG